MTRVDALSHHVEAQDQGRTWDTALAELRAGHKRSHWMWFVFPQLAGLGRSPTARRFALEDVAEAHAYLAHPVLGPRLRAATDVLLGLTDHDPVAVLGDVDAMKLRSSMTLFAAAAPGDERFERVLRQWFGGVADEATIGRL